MESKGGEEWLTLGSAELGHGVDETLVEVGRPPQPGLGVRRQYKARPAGAGARRPIAGSWGVSAVVDQARREHLFLLLLLLLPPSARTERRLRGAFSFPQKRRIQSEEKFLGFLSPLSCWFLLLPLSTGSDSSLSFFSSPALSLSLSLSLS